MPRRLALRVLSRLDDRPGTVERLLEEEMVRHPGMAQRDRGFALHIIQGVLRYRLRLDWIIKGAVKFPFSKIEPRVVNILRIALYQIFFMDRVPESAAVNEAVKEAGRGGAGHVRGFVNGILRHICRNKDSIEYPDRIRDREKFLSVFHSYPDWMVRKWKRELGIEGVEALLEAQNRIPSLIVRTNTLRTDRDGLKLALEKEGVDAVPTTYSPLGLVLGGLKGPVNGLESFKKGLFQVQGEAAQIAGSLILPCAGNMILDICAGVGGKTTHLGQASRDSSFITALDIDRGRLVSLMESSARLGTESISALVGDATADMSRLFSARFDCILADPPCSALGTLARHPDGKWVRSKDDISRLSQMQLRIMEGTIPLLKGGGRIAYLTCTISKQENEDVVDSLIERHPDLSMVDLREEGPAWARELFDERGLFRALPHIHGTEGFFGALLTKS